MLLPSHPPLTIDPGSRTGRSVAPALPAPWSWQRAEDGFRISSGKMPIARPPRWNCRARHGPAGLAFGRFGREQRQNLRDAIGAPAGLPVSPAAPRTCDATKRRKQPNARPGDRCAGTVGPSSLTTGGRPAPRSTGATGDRSPAPVRRLRDAGGARNGAERGTSRRRAPGGGGGSGLEGRRPARTRRGCPGRPPGNARACPGDCGRARVVGGGGCKAGRHEQRR